MNMKIEVKRNNTIVKKEDNKNHPYFMNSTDDSIPIFPEQVKVGDFLAFWDIPNFDYVWYPIKSITVYKGRGIDMIFQPKLTKEQIKRKAKLYAQVDLCPNNLILTYEGKVKRVKDLQIGEYVVKVNHGMRDHLRNEYPRPDQNKTRIEHLREHMRVPDRLVQIREWDDPSKAPIGYNKDLLSDIYVLEFENVQPNHWFCGPLATLIRGDE